MTNVFIYENGQLIPAQESKSRVFCGYYAAMGYNGEKAGDLFVVLSGPVLAPAYDENGTRINVGKSKSGKSSRDGKTWYNE